MINRVVLVGRLTRDPELRKTTTGTSVASFTLAVDNRIKDANGQYTTSFIPCVVWKEQAENCVRFIHKGSLVGVEGRLNHRTYDNQEGKKVQVIEVVCDSIRFLESKKADEETPNTSSNNANTEEEFDDFPF